ncbi:MAG: hypothetical protein HOD92_23600 [Deltaproteobacteria bacterium]|jgi:hypothetical protein|nr:hypothetical protein [Deltaproteobacteria bacterium]MBT4524955.1 hypothetical protein [Deltaproteobacteria bacterium]
MKNRFLFISVLISAMFLFQACSSEQPKPEPIAVEDFLTLADVTGKTSFKEDSPDIRVINVKAKAFIKKNDTRMARQKALERAGKMAVDEMVRELLSAEVYNRRFQEIETYFSKNVDKYIAKSEVNKEMRIFNDAFYGISTSFKVNRQKVLVAIQKDLGFIDKSASSLITVITSKKNLDLSSVGYRFSDIEDALMNQIQTDLNQRGLTAMDQRNAINSLKSDPKNYKKYSKISKGQFLAMVSGSKAADAELDAQIQNAEEFYSTGLTLIKQLAKVVVEVNILALSRTGSTMTLNLGVTAKNISTSTGGAFANEIVQAARRAGSNTDPAAMLTGLIKDAYEEMQQKFIPQVLKEMSTIDVKGNKLVEYELVFTGFAGKQPRVIKNAVNRAETEDFRFISYDNTLGRAKPPINSVVVRYSGSADSLSEKVMNILDELNYGFKEPITAPNLKDIVFEKEMVNN